MKKIGNPTRRSAGERADVPQNRLLEIACQLMAARGFHGVTFQAIADEAGISQTTVMHYFKDRANLIKRVIQYVLESNREFVAGLESKSIALKDSPLQNYFRGNFSWAKNRPEQASVILLFYYMGSVEAELASLYLSIRNSARSKIAELLKPGDEKKRNQSAEILHDAFLGGLLNLVSTQTMQTGEKEFMDKLDSLVRLLS